MFATPLAADAELRPLEPWRAEEFLANIDRSREHITPWVGLTFVVKDLAEAKAVLQRYADRVASDSGGIWGIWHNDTLVGGVMFVSFDTATGVCEAGCWIEPASQGRGLVRAAVERIIDWAIYQRGMHRVEWHTDSENERSIRLAERLGMTREGTLRQRSPGARGRSDMTIYAILADEWRARRGEPVVG